MFPATSTLACLRFSTPTGKVGKRGELDGEGDERLQNGLAGIWWSERQGDNGAGDRLEEQHNRKYVDDGHAKASSDGGDHVENSLPGHQTGDTASAVLASSTLRASHRRQNPYATDVCSVRRGSMQIDSPLARLRGVSNGPWSVHLIQPAEKSILQVCYLDSRRSSLPEE